LFKTEFVRIDTLVHQTEVVKQGLVVCVGR
jgi:hypothetical protein